MSTEEQSIQLLTEIRDLQQQLLVESSRVSNEALALQREAFTSQQHALAESSRAANEALALQREAFTSQQHAIVQQARAVEMQRKSARLYRVVVFVAALFLCFLIWKLPFGF
ncbi:MAG: hypothetical protein QM772_06435 [Ottowia sp.]|uniref:hypothetical protein n=1 Tax=Ottowia sp. TaxID=1898956 RepID=UPI0039E47380